MALTLPEVKKGVFLNFDHFPTVQQCFVYRNWEMIPAAKLAEVIGTTEDNINSLAYGMGLPKQEYIEPKWMTAGYITIIKANWHLINYDQLCSLLGWNRDKLAYILKEDDFLAHKLDNFKPDVPELKYRPLTADEIHATESVKRATEKALAAFEPKTVESFDFAKMFARSLGGKASTIAGPDRFDTRIVYSYCALYGDTFIGDTQKMSFPDELLEAYRAVGVNGIWAQAVLYTLVPFKFKPELSEGWQERIDGLNDLCDRLEKYGIKLYLYINEPRSMPNEFFDEYPNIRGAERSGFTSMCTSTPEVQEYLTESAAELVRRVPKLGGFITITASENQTNCYSHFTDGNQPCPRCAKRTRAEVVAEVNSLLYKGASSVNPDFKLLAWTWSWMPDVAEDAINLMDKNVGVMAVSERLLKKTIGGVETSVDDYSISIPGPGKYAVDIWKQAKASGHPAYAKCQFNNTWECAAVPFLPVYDLIYKHMIGLTKENVDGLMLDWTLGGYPSPTFAMLKPFFIDTGHIPTLDELYKSVFPDESVEVVKAACHLFSEAFEEFPFYIGVLYQAPQNLGVGNLLYTKPTGFRSTMTCFPYDCLEEWRSIFPEDVFENQMKLLTDKWAQGLDELKKLSNKLVSENPVLQEICDAAESAYCQFRAVYLQTRFIRIRDGRIDGNIDDVVDEEEEITIRCANVAAHNSCIGYESANHYYFNRVLLMEKIVCCEYVKEYFNKI